MFILSDKKKRIRSLFLVIFVGLALAAGFVLSKTKETDTIAATVITANGAHVELSRVEPDISYSGSSHTIKFQITTHGATYLAFCRNPKHRGPDSGSNSEREDLHAALDFQGSPMPLDEAKRNIIKMMAYLASASAKGDQTAIDAYNTLFNNAKSYYTSHSFDLDDADIRYAFSHAVMAWVTDPTDFYELAEVDRPFVNQLTQNVLNLITSDSNAWAVARNYKLFGLQGYPREMTEDEDAYEQLHYHTGMHGYQDIVWVEGPVIKTGNLKIQKCMKGSGETCNSPRVGTNFGGIQFELYNNTGHRIYYDEAFYANGAKIKTITLTSTETEKTISNLPIGNYKVKEVSGNQWYSMDATPERTATVSEGLTESVQFFNNIKTGKIIIRKVDAETGTCSKLGKASFAGTQFKLTKNGVEIIKELSANDCSVTFDDLLYGDYSVEEIAAGAGYKLTEGPIAVTITETNSVVERTVSNQVIRGDLRFRKRDKNNNELMANVPFRITSVTTGENHIVVTNNEGIVDTSSGFNLHSFHTNGYDGITDFSTIVDKKYGTWFGSTTVDDNLGALPYDNYIITELSCDQNMYCYDIEGEQTTVQITSNGVVKDIGDWDNDCAVFSIETIADDYRDHDKYVEAGEHEVIQDTVDYCAKRGMSFTIKGVLMDKGTGEKLEIDHRNFEVEQLVDVPTSGDGCGRMVMKFDIDTSTIAGKEIVVYEYLYHDDELLAAHEDINDEAQTVTIVSLTTTATDKKDGDKYIEADKNGVATIVDEVNYCAKAGEEYRLEGMLVIRRAAEGEDVVDPVIQEKEFTAPEGGCGTEIIEFPVNVSELAGEDIVVYEALYRKGENSPIITHHDKNDEDQIVSVVSLDTTAVDNLDGDIFVNAVETASIRDIVDFCAKEGVTYTLKGVVMDKATKEPLLINGEKIEKTKEVTVPEGGCGSEAVVFRLDASEIAGKELVVFESLYEGESLVVKHEDLKDESQTVNIISLKTIAVDDGDEDKYLDKAKDRKVRDIVEYCVKPGIEYTIKGVLMDKSTGKELEIDGKKFEKELLIEPVKSCGTVALEFPLDASSIAGMNIVVFEYLYHEGDVILSHNYFRDYDQTVSVVSLFTFATDKKSGKKQITVGKETTIVDEVKYCFKANSIYEVKGILMDKKTEKPILIDGKTIEEKVTISVDEDTCGETQIVYKFDSSKLAGMEVVIFDEVYENGKLILSHTDIENVDQTVELVAPPDTGMFTTILGDGAVANGVRLGGMLGAGLVVFYLARRRAVRKNKIGW